MDKQEETQMKKKIVVAIHTSFVSVEKLKSLFAETVPDAIVHNIVDDSLLAEVMANGSVTPAIVKRYCAYASTAESLGADLIFNQCSSVGEAVNIARKTISIPILKVDEPMAELAVATGSRIAVVATVKSTMAPSVNLVKEAARNANKTVQIQECLVDGALDILMKEKNQEKHNQLVLDAIHKAAKTNDVIVLAQGSMVVLQPFLDDVGVPVLTSPQLGVERLRCMLNA